MKTKPNELDRLAGELLQRGKKTAEKVAEDELTKILDELSSEGRRKVRTIIGRLIVWGDKKTR